MTLTPRAIAKDRVALFEGLYENTFPAVARFVSARKGSLQEAKDIFHDALVVYYEKTLGENFEIISDEAYILGIAKHLWIRKYRSDKKHVSMNQTELLINIPDDFYHEVKSAKLVNLLERAGKKCMELLSAFYYNKFSMADLSNNFGFSSERSATVQKFKCLEKVRDIVKEKSLNYEDFTG